MNRIIFFLLGIVWAVFGLSIIISPKFYSSKYDYIFDFTELKWPFGGFLVLLGSLFIWSALRKKASEFEDKFLVCPKCKTPFNHKDVPDGRCPKCEVELEDLEGFYQRHPELKAG